MRILKFGGTSVGSAENIAKVLDILLDYQKKGITYAVVVSAVSGMTNKLIEMSNKAAEKDDTYTDLLTAFEETHYSIVRALVDVKQQSTLFADIKRLINELQDVLQGVYLLNEISAKALDFIVSHGERLSASIITQAAIEKGIQMHYLDARKLIRTNSNYGYAKVNFNSTNKAIADHFTANKGKIFCITGFIASDEKEHTTTLGRGGSDYTAAIFAAALNAEVCEIWTDVDGVMTTDPRKVKNAFTLPAISYSEAMELSHFGAKVIYPPTLQPLFAKNIPIYIKNTFKPEFAGTYISRESDPNSELKVKGISSIDGVTLVSVQGSGMVGVPGVSARLFGCLARNEINLILITQASSEHSICFAVEPGKGDFAKTIIEEEFAYEVEAGKIDPVKVEKEYSVVAIIGENMKDTPGISGKMFSALGKNGINIAAIAQGSSELNISVVIKKQDIAKALNALHDTFFLSGSRTINLFLIGPGLIGATLLKQIAEQRIYLHEKKSLNINVIAIANSRKMVFDVDGIALSSWQQALEAGETMNLDAFVAKMKTLNMPNSVFIDNTSNKFIIDQYKEILNASISIVTPNKIANSGSYAHYLDLHSTAALRGVKFLYETNVGAGLPVINTLQNLINSGDEIIRIEGVLSGSLSFIFNTYDGSTSFKEVVLKAKELGFTEPDPRDDLNGMDVARKILILARESGMALEPADVNIENILPEACIKAATVDQFFEELEKSEPVFKKLIDDAKQTNSKLCFVATLEKGKVTVALRAVDANHPFNSLSGSDNMISYTTERYKNNPLVIKGPGAGAEVTAAGVFADIITIGNYLS